MAKSRQYNTRQANGLDWMGQVKVEVKVEGRAGTTARARNGNKRREQTRDETGEERRRKEEKEIHALCTYPWRRL